MKKLALQVQRSDEGERLDRFIARVGAIARGEARRALERGGVWLDGKRVKVASRPVHGGQVVVVVLEEGGRPEPAAAELGPSRILYEDELVIAVDKPAGVTAQATLATDRGNLVDLVSRHLGAPAGLVHRLDAETSGVTIFGKTAAATGALARAFREGTAQKRYLAAAWGALPDEGRVDLPIGPDPSRKGRYLAIAGRGLPAATRFRVLARDGSLLAVEALPETGRTHQIRVHLTTQGAPLAGDTLYGGPVEVSGSRGASPATRVMLHARSLRVPHPAGGREVEIVAPVPEDLGELFALAGADPSRL